MFVASLATDADFGRFRTSLGSRFELARAS